jgi:hypothetical protein
MRRNGMDASHFEGEVRGELEKKWTLRADGMAGIKCPSDL